jgi:23S rRNA-/tRNA-specific pseudouridylate synthase
VLRRAGGRALLLAEPTTGRTHQLRVQLAARGTPIVGDDVYGPPFAPGAASAAERVQLHAHRLALPARGGRPARLLEAPLPPDLEVAELEVAEAPALVTCPVPQPEGADPRWT